MSDWDALTEKLRSAGWEASRSGDVLSATKEVILSRWFLGSRRVRLHLSCRFDEAGRTVFCRESATEVAIGLPPPTLSFSSYKQQGLDVDETRKDTSAGGGGEMHYGEVRRWVQAACANAGWTFTADLELVR